MIELEKKKFLLCSVYVCVTNTGCLLRLCQLPILLNGHHSDIERFFCTYIHELRISTRFKKKRFNNKSDSGLAAAFIFCLTKE